MVKSLSFLQPKLQGFEQLFILDENVKDKWGLQRGSTLLISGSPGAGKTTFALSLVRSLMIGSKKSGPSAENFIFFYISPEISENRLRTTLNPLGWLALPGDKDDTNDEYGLWQQTNDDKLSFVVIAPYPEIDRPVPSPEDQVNQIFNRIADRLAPAEGKPPNAKYLVVVDSITALLKGCAAPGDERRQTHEILHRLEKTFGADLALTVLLAEQDLEPASPGQVSLVEDYLAHVVFRLYHKPLPLGRRQRTLEIVKSQGVNMIPGEHSWAIVTKANYKKQFRDETLQKAVKDNALLITDCAGKKELMWSTIAIFPRPRMLSPSRIQNISPIAEPDQPIHTGTEGLDQLLRRTPEYWLSAPADRGRTQRRQTPALRPNSVTLLVGSLGSGKSALCLQFLLRGAWDRLHKLTKRYASGKVIDKWLAERRQNTENTKHKSVFVCLSIESADIVGHACQDAAIALTHVFGISGGDEQGIRAEVAKRLREELLVLDFMPSQFDFNSLITHLDWAIEHNTPARIAFDGLSEWLEIEDRAIAAKRLETIHSTIAHHPNYRKDGKSRPAVFMTYELPTEGDPLAPQAVGAYADNIIALKQVNLQDEIHKIVYVVKSGGSSREQNVRELKYNNTTHQLEVCSGLDTFNGLLQGRFEPAEVLLQIFRENYGEKCFNQWLKHRLSRLSNLRFRILDFTRSDIKRVLEDTQSQTLFPPSDLKIVHVDEWWLSQRYAIPERKTEGIFEDNCPLLDLRSMWNLHENKYTLAPSWQEYWWFELDKAGPPSTINSRGSALQTPDEYYAVPGHMDYGQFCINIRLLLRENLPITRQTPSTCRNPLLDVPFNRKDTTWDALVRLSSQEQDRVAVQQQSVRALQDVWKHYADATPRVWVQQKGNWFSEGGGDGTVVRVMKDLVAAYEKRKKSEHEKLWGFAFDIETRENCVSFFFELAWAFGARERFLTPNTNGKLAPGDIKACQTALTFLQFLVLEGLMPYRASVETTRYSLFSRHYYSTMQSVFDLDRWEQHGGKIDEEYAGKFARWSTADAPTMLPAGPVEYTPPSLIALPWFPSGAMSAPDKNAVRETTERLLRLMERASMAGYLPKAGKAESELKKATTSIEPKVAKLPLLNATRELLQHLRERPKPTKEAEQKPTATLADLLEITRQHIQRMKLLYAKPGAKISELANCEEDILLEDLSQMEKKSRLVHAGYACTGSWMYGIHRSTRSASLAKDLLQEITSLEAAEERARRGAGIPARHDFFEYHGHESVPGMEYQTWNQLLTNSAARTRRRGRLIAPEAKPAYVHQIIHDEILDALQRAHLRIKDYLGKGLKIKKQVIADVCRGSVAAIDAIARAASYKAD